VAGAVRLPSGRLTPLAAQRIVAMSSFDNFVSFGVAISEVIVPPISEHVVPGISEIIVPV